jgi:hypothetical protein
MLRSSIAAAVSCALALEPVAAQARLSAAQARLFAAQTRLTNAYYPAGNDPAGNVSFPPSAFSPLGTQGARSLRIRSTWRLRHFRHRVRHHRVATTVYVHNAQHHAGATRLLHAKRHTAKRTLRKSRKRTAVASRRGKAVTAKKVRIAAIPLPPIRPIIVDTNALAVMLGDLGSIFIEAPRLLLDSVKTTSDALADAVALEFDRQFLIETAMPGATMARQGVRLSIERLHPVFARRLAAAIRDARLSGLPDCGVGSAYRPPGFRVGGFRNKFESAHAYGLAVDMAGIGRPRSGQAKLWYQVALRNGLFVPYGPNNRAEWNHTQATGYRMVTREAPLRKTITAKAPIDEVRMWQVGDSVLDRGPRTIQASRRHVRYTRHAARQRIMHRQMEIHAARQLHRRWQVAAR